MQYMDPMGENVTTAWTSQETAKLNTDFLFMSKHMELKMCQTGILIMAIAKKREESSAVEPVSQTVNFNS